MFGIGVRLPLSVDDVDGHFALTKTLLEETRQNLFHLIMTAPGERIMDIDFGVGIRKYLFEPLLPQTEEIIKGRIYSQVKRYLPFVLINYVSFSSDPALNFLGIQLSYQVPSLGGEDTLVFDFT